PRVYPALTELLWVEQIYVRPTISGPFPAIPGYLSQGSEATALAQEHPAEVVSQGPPMACLMPKAGTEFTLQWPPQTSVCPRHLCPSQLAKSHTFKPSDGSRKPPKNCSLGTPLGALRIHLHMWLGTGLSSGRLQAGTRGRQAACTVCTKPGAFFSEEAALRERWIGHYRRLKARGAPGLAGGFRKP
ncbi:hypothetical protein P7K49_006066, partial [Saguinus oedipus]